MDEITLDTITGWDTDPLGEGVDGLHELSTRAFSGAVEAGPLWALLVNGKVVSVTGGELAEMNGRGVAYEAPDPGLPLLFAMREHGEPVERGYTEETPLASVHERLDGGRFSGYLELSEYVLSGDYYVVYHGDRSFPVAFVGAHRRVRTGADAMRLATDEVGIFEVYRADVSVVPLP